MEFYHVYSVVILLLFLMALGAFLDYYYGDSEL